MYSVEKRLIQQLAWEYRLKFLDGFLDNEFCLIGELNKEIIEIKIVIDSDHIKIVNGGETESYYTNDLNQALDRLRTYFNSLLSVTDYSINHSVQFNGSDEHIQLLCSYFHELNDMQINYLKGQQPRNFGRATGKTFVFCLKFVLGGNELEMREVVDCCKQSVLNYRLEILDECYKRLEDSPFIIRRRLD